MIILLPPSEKYIVFNIIRTHILLLHVFWFIIWLYKILQFRSQLIMAVRAINFTLVGNQCVGSSSENLSKYLDILKGSPMMKRRTDYHQVWIFLPVGENGLNEVCFVKYILYIYSYILPPSEKYISSINRKYTIITMCIWL